VKRVVVGMLDPNKEITGKGVLRLQAAGIQVDIFPDGPFKRVAEQNREFSRVMREPAPPPAVPPMAKQTISVAPALGLQTVATRDDVTQILPPVEFYNSATRELAITGVSAARTFDIHLSILRSALARGRRVYVLILDPASPDVRWLTRREGRSIGADIRSTLKIARLEGFLQHAGFELRLSPKLSPFTAVMLDGNISGAQVADDDVSYLRVQPGTLLSSQHDGVVLQFRRMPMASVGFDYFAEDLRRQWQAARRVRK
jgi:hypothetical protein